MSRSLIVQVGNIDIGVVITIVDEIYSCQQKIVKVDDILFKTVVKSSENNQHKYTEFVFDDTKPGFCIPFIGSQKRLITVCGKISLMNLDKILFPLNHPKLIRTGNQARQKIIFADIPDRVKFKFISIDLFEWVKLNQQLMLFKNNKLYSNDYLVIDLSKSIDIIITGCL